MPVLFLRVDRGFLSSVVGLGCALQRHPLLSLYMQALWPVGYLDFRRRELERFLNRLVKKPFVCASKPFLVFMCRPSNQLAEGQKVAETEVARMTRNWEAQTMRLKGNGGRRVRLVR